MTRWLSTATIIASLVSSHALSAEVKSFNPDSDTDRIAWTQIANLLGPAPDVHGERFGVVLKTQTNEYWRLMAAGYRRRAAVDGVKLDIQAAANEMDRNRQLSIMETMIGSRYKGLIVSPQSDSNLMPAVEDAITAGVPLVNVDGAGDSGIAHFVGPMNREIGARVAQWFLQHIPGGGQVAVIEGQQGALSTVQRSAGFREALAAAPKFTVVASASGDWLQQRAYDETLSILRRWPDLIGIYCNNDVMALGAVDAVKHLNLLRQVRVFGTDGSQVAYASIRAGDLTGTVSIFPSLIGEVGLEIAERLSVGQAVPRVVETPQALVTLENIARYGDGRGP